MFRRGERTQWITVGVVGAAVLGACGATPSHHKSTVKVAPAQAKLIVPTPVDASSLTRLSTSGTFWLVGGPQSSRGLYQFTFTSDRELRSVPLASGATSVTALANGLLAVGIGTASSGAVEIRSADLGALQRSIPTAGPVLAVASAITGDTIFALVTVHGAASVVQMNEAGRLVGPTISIPSNSVGISVSPRGNTLYTLTSTGSVVATSTRSGVTLSNFTVGHSGEALSESEDGQTLYVLKGPGSQRNVAVVNLQTEEVLRVLPAPADAVALAVEASSGTLFDLVGSASVGNVQEFSLS